MSAVLSWPRTHPEARPARRIVLLGTGTVATAFIERHAQLAGRIAHLPPIGVIANARGSRTCDDQSPAEVAHALCGLPAQASAVALPVVHAGDLVVDATASDAVAACHAPWLAAGADVITANKLGAGGPLARWQAIEQARRRSGRHYGDSATVGAGLPVLASLRSLRAGGDAIHGVAGVLSGSLGWLFQHHDGSEAFSALVRRAHAQGFTEPDPRQDLSGADVKRKLLILARAAGQALPEDAVTVESLLPQALPVASGASADLPWHWLDARLRERLAQAQARGEVLRFVGRLHEGRARVALEALPREDPLAGGSGTDNRVALWSDRYRERPLLVQGPGAGAAVTAAALLDDVLRAAKKLPTGIGRPNA